MRSYRAFLYFLLALSALPSVVWAQVSAGEDLDGAVQRARRAFLAADEETLKEIAGNRKPDVWLVVDGLLAVDGRDAARAVARHVRSPDSDALPRYLDQWPSRDEDPARKALAALETALGSGDPERALAVELEVGKQDASVPLVRFLLARVKVFQQLRRFPKVVEVCEKARAIAEEIGWLQAVSETIYHRAFAFYWTDGLRSAEEGMRELVEIQRRRGDRTGVSRALSNHAVMLRGLGRFKEAHPVLEESVRLGRELGDESGVSIALGNLATNLADLGRYEESLTVHQQVLELFEKTGDRAGYSRTLGTMASVLDDLGDYPRALANAQRALEMYTALGEEREVVVTQNLIGCILISMGRHQKAALWLERCRVGAEKLRSASLYARALSNLAICCRHSGEFALAFKWLEATIKLWQQMGNQSEEAKVYTNLGNLYASVGDFEKALEWHLRSLRMHRKLKSAAGTVRSLGNVAAAYESVNRLVFARRTYQDALVSARKLGDPAEVLHLQFGLTMVHLRREDWESAAGMASETLDLATKLGAREYERGTRLLLGEALLGLGKESEALTQYETALEIGEELVLPPGMAEAKLRIARLHHRAGRHREALAAAREGIEISRPLWGRLGDEQSIMSRESWSLLFETGQLAAYALGDVEEFIWFLETGRAGSLLKALKGGGAFRESVVPQALLHGLEAARATEVYATRAYREVRERGSRKQKAKCRKTLEEARERVRVATQRIQREAAASAEVLYPSVVDTRKIAASLAPGEALVLYLLSEETMAVVVTADGARLVSLGSAQPVRDACAALWQASGAGAASAPTREPEGQAPSGGTSAVSRLRSLVADPLKLPESVNRVLISPHDALGFVPHALFWPKRKVALLPSGTVLELLRRQSFGEGEGVLALGDPAYGEPAVASPGPGPVRGERLTRLPATREEAKAVGDVVLLGKEAGEARLAKALRERSRWRAVHLACHGVVYPERPVFSNLAITPDETGDGFLTCLEVFRMKIPADLVVLSACETAGGKAYRSEGIVGLTRAFMMAGAPRVICSLWQVDDEATKALMVKFYELWNPERGKGLPAATALKQAQDFVRRQEKWKHPAYWAAWVLWGLPD